MGAGIDQLLLLSIHGQSPEIAILVSQERWSTGHIFGIRKSKRRLFASKSLHQVRAFESLNRWCGDALRKSILNCTILLSATDELSVRGYVSRSSWDQSWERLGVHRLECSSQSQALFKPRISSVCFKIMTIQAFGLDMMNPSCSERVPVRVVAYHSSSSRCLTSFAIKRSKKGWDSRAQVPLGLLASGVFFRECLKSATWCSTKFAQGMLQVRNPLQFTCQRR